MMYGNYAEVKTNLFVKLSSGERNSTVLNNIVGTTYHDLIVTCHLLLDDDGDQIASVAIQKEWLKKWHVEEEQLIRDTIDSGEKLFPAYIRKLYELIGIGRDEPDISMIVITNDRFINGAATILYPGVLDRVGDMIGGSYYIIPSSIHDMIAVANGNDIYGEYLNKMIVLANNNKNCVPENEVLSNHAYHYDALEKIFEPAEAFEHRVNITR